MFNPILNLLDRDNSNQVMNIVLIGAGGNAGPLVQKIARTMYAYQETIEDRQYWNNQFNRTSMIIVDGDMVEEKNLLRQPFIDEDIGQYKSEVLSERYATAYGVPIYSRNSYIDNASEIKELFDNLYEINSRRSCVSILIGCVDNNRTRQIMHEFFMSEENMIYIDAGIEGVTGETDIELFESGYSGQVVCGLRSKGETILEPVGVVFPDILEDKESRTPTQACGLTVVNHPQRMQTNETAALIVHSYINNLIFDGVITSHYVNFDALTMNTKPTYLKKVALDFFNTQKERLSK